VHSNPKQKRWLLRSAVAALVLLAVIGGDLLKCTLLCDITAHRFGATRTQVQRITFDGLWRVTLNANVPGSGGRVRYSVTPILPLVIAK
jgi:hypothetical protein